MLSSSQTSEEESPPENARRDSASLQFQPEDMRTQTSRRKRTALVCLAIFLVAIGVRALCWHDNRFEARKVETFVTDEYKEGARKLAHGEFKAFLTDLNHMEHPPGYSILLAIIFKVFGDSDAVIQFVQIIADAACTVLVFLLVAELLPRKVAVIAGLLAACSPQFSYYATLLLPDSLSVLPILVAVYLLIRATKRPRLITFAMAGAMVGVSCLLRANSLLLAPFLVAVIPFLFARGQRLKFATVLMVGTLVVVAPVTIKNYVVFKRFIPLSLGAGQKLLEGIAEYDTDGKLGVPKTDLGIMRQEAAMYNKPEYALLLFGEDGIERDRWRVARGVALIRSHPGWYAGVMLKRAGSFFRLARTPIVAPYPPVSRASERLESAPLVWSRTPSELIADGGATSAQTKIAMADDGQMLNLVGDDSKYGSQLQTQAIAVKQKTDYIFSLPFKLETGRMILNVVDADRNELLSSTIIDVMEGVPPPEQPTKTLRLSFVSGNASRVRFVLGNGASAPVTATAQVGRIELSELGPTTFLWTHYPRLLVRAVQKFFITAWMLPLTIIGIVLLVWARRWSVLAVLLIVPAYYICVQSALHTEYRYVFAIHYFLLIFAACALYWMGQMLWSASRRVVGSTGIKHTLEKG